MTDYGTIRIPREDFERHNERRKDMNLSWLEYLDGERPDPSGVDLDSLEDRIVVRIARENEADLQNFEQQLKNTQGNGDIMNRLDDLENTIPRKTAEELR